MAKGYGADPTLVAAAYRLGQSYGPADYTKIFEYQYEGLAKSIKAKYEAYGTMFKAGADMLIDIHGKVKARDEEGKEALSDTGKTLTNDPTYDYHSDSNDFTKSMNELSTNHTDGVIGDNKDNYSTTNPSVINAAEFQRDKNEFLNYKEIIESFSGKLYLTNKQKEERNDAIKGTLKLRETINNHRATINAKGEAWNKGFIDKKNTFENDPDLMFLTGQVLDKGGDLSRVGITTFYKDEEVYYKYPVGLANPILKDIQRKAKELDNISLNTPDLVETLDSKGMLGGKKRVGLDVPKLKTKELKLPTPKEYKVISAKQLFGGLKEVDNKTRNTLESETTNVIELAQDMLKGSDVPSIENYEKIEKKTQRNIRSHLNESSNYRNITGNPLLIAGQEVDWGIDLNENIEIDIAVINQDFIGSNILTLDQLKKWDSKGGGTNGTEPDGKLDQEELDKHKDAKKILINKLLNPSTQQEKEISVNEFSKYISGYIKQAFDNTRTRMGITSERKTKLMKAIESNQKNITIGRERFELQDNGSYKLTQVLPQGEPTWMNFGEDVFYTKDEFMEDYGKRFKAKQ